MVEVVVDESELTGLSGAKVLDRREPVAQECPVS
jgi:hypothetical protein